MRITDLICFISVLLVLWAIYFFVKPFLLKKIWKKTDYKKFDEFYQYCVKHRSKGGLKPTYKFGYVTVVSFLIGFILLVIVFVLIYNTVLLGTTDYRGILDFKF